MVKHAAGDGTRATTQRESARPSLRDIQKGTAHLGPASSRPRGAVLSHPACPRPPPRRAPPAPIMLTYHGGMAHDVAHAHSRDPRHRFIRGVAVPTPPISAVSMRDVVSF